MLTELRPKKDLLEPNFNGYKLSLDTIPVYRHSLTEGVDNVSQSEDQYSFIHTKVFSLHNYLHSDPWHDNTVYFVDKTWKVCKVAVNVDTGRLDGVESVWTIPHLDKRKIGHFNISILFPTPETAVLADGCGHLYILSHTNSNWQQELSCKVAESDTGSLLATSRLCDDGALHCVLMALETVAAEPNYVPLHSEKSKPATITTVLHWITFSKDGEGTWNVSCRRRLEGAGSVDYVALEDSCSALYVGSNAVFKFTDDSLNPLPPPEEKVEIVNKKTLYTWEQTDDDLKVFVEVQPEVTRDSVEVEVKERELTVRCEQTTIVSGELYQAVDTDLTTWTLGPGRLELTLSKRETGLMWPELVLGNQQGQQVMNPALVGEVHARLSHLCSDTEVRETGEECAPTFNLDQLEECDSAPEDNRSLVRLDTTSHTVTHQISLAGHQWLMSVCVRPDSTPCVCLRHDVDGCVWQLDTPFLSTVTDWPCEHIGTFCALGYVAASKQQKKFILAAPDLSFAVICEASSHVFVYRKATIINGELRNRKTSTKVSTVAKQQLINLDSLSPVLGAQVSNTHLFVLTTDTMYIYHIQ